LFDDGQSRRMVDEGPISVVVVRLGGEVELDVEDESGVAEGEEGGAVLLLLLLLAAMLADVLVEIAVSGDVVSLRAERVASTPPTPPATAAAMTIVAMIEMIQNVRFRSPQIVFGLSISCTRGSSAISSLSSSLWLAYVGISSDEWSYRYFCVMGSWARGTASRSEWSFGDIVSAGVDLGMYVRPKEK
jgi:hypothetical protein